MCWVSLPGPGLPDFDLKSRDIRGVETRKSFVQPVKVAGSGSSKLNDRTWAPFALRSSQRGELMSEEVQRTSEDGGMRECLIIAESVALPSLPVMEVRASIVR